MVEKIKYTLNLIMDTKEIKIECPEGYTIDRENSTFECIKFKPIKRWRDGNPIVKGWYLDEYGVTAYNKYGATFLKWKDGNLNVFATEKQAKSALAMAQISQIMANDEKFGGPVTDKEWNNIHILKSTIIRTKEDIIPSTAISNYYFLAFHTQEQRDLFLKENEDLVKDYLMIN